METIIQPTNHATPDVRVLEASLSQMTYCADFGRVEAMVTLLVKDRTGQPPHEIRLRTSQPKAGDAPVEDRLIADAVKLARHMPRRSAPTRPATVPTARPHQLALTSVKMEKQPECSADLPFAA